LVEAHYTLVGESLLFTLEKALGAAFTSKVNESWVGVYKIISEQMMLGAQEYA
jgi:hemoglobin-like flavoprotein